MEGKIKEWIKSFVRKYSELRSINFWREPVVGFADATSPFERLRKVIDNHLLPEEILEGARSVVVFFIPFTKEVVESNVKGKYASRLWATSYVETNRLISELANYVVGKLEARGYASLALPPTHNFDEVNLISDWSHKHVAYIAGLGTFGFHTMLITEKGCCGRLGSLITRAELKPGEPKKEEFCLHARGLECRMCVKKCAFGALKQNGLDKRKCYEICLENDRFFNDLPLTDVCGKCACGVPCSLRIPDDSR
ncbi:MAG: epoxyqueuosine reductase [Archaeoglobales archaeon]|nr:MAG: epoxyqueuosine reductase [Archaeoglobales archaeon]